ncbi:MAG: Uma2 family endonuclease [Candidatus Heimdallarchaeota archaeon]|nr:Uma2 family endonuclease [Candidatus Heimdallarchaeota archaeon]
MLSIINSSNNKSTQLREGTLLIVKGATWDDYWNLSTEDLKVEYIEEMLYIHSPASVGHEKIFGEVYFELKQFIKQRNKGIILGSRFPILLKDGKRAEPDIVFISNKEINKGNLTETIFKGTPSLIVEIVSPSYRDHDTVTKLQQYKELGVEEYWIIDPELLEINQIQFSNNEIKNNKTLKTGIITPFIEDLNDFSINLDHIWELLS